ncbi:MurR/RpiR family transcriptional regulator [Thomasclavelia spiroformis]|uniref:MurR/RpiR family transcriptional regulator n=1 Tax=Thomasclavelia spiroformis TaxID=29348 RepID=UPI0039936855
MESLFDQLVIYLDTANEIDTNYNIAWYVVRNFSKITKMTINELADNCYVSPATISRFCKSLGYENYLHFKQACTLDKVFDNYNMDLTNMRYKPKECTKNYLKNICNEISKLSSVLEWDIIDEVLQVIHNSKKIVFFQNHFLHFVSLYFQIDLLSLGKLVYAPVEYKRQLECAKSLNENSVAIVINDGEYIRNNFRIIQYLKKSKCKTVLLTNKQDTKISMNYTIKLKSNMSRYTLLAIIELMIYRYRSLYYLY